MSLPQTETQNPKAELDAVVEAIRSHDRFLVATHENPDGDALGSILAMKLALEQLGKDAFLYLSGIIPLPSEYDFMDLGAISRELPGDADERVVLALDCANERRLGPDSSFVERSPLVVDIDHHHDNSRFGQVNLIVADASSTGEILYDLFAELGVELTPEHRRGALHRARHRHRALPVHEHHAEGAAHRRAPGRGRGERPPGLPGRLRERRLRQAEAARPGARERQGLRGRPRHRRRPRARRLRRGRGGGALRGGDHRLPSLGRGRGDRRPHP